MQIHHGRGSSFCSHVWGFGCGSHCWNGRFRIILGLFQKQCQKTASSSERLQLHHAVISLSTLFPSPQYCCYVNSLFFISRPTLAAPKASESNFISKMKASGRNIVVFYGSQTGTAEEFAGRLAKEAARYGMKALVADPEECQMVYCSTDWLVNSGQNQHV